MQDVRTWSCERARQWVSLRADGELSQLEQARLERHLGACPSCAAAAGGLAGVAQLLRSAPLARPHQPAAVVGVPARVARRRLLVPVGVAGAVAVAAAGLLVAVLPAPRVAPLQRPAVPPAGKRLGTDSARQWSAWARSGADARWPGHGATT